MTRRVYMMAQGSQERLTALEHPKQLVQVAGKSLAGRTVALLRDLDVSDIVLVAPANICWTQWRHIYGVRLLTLEAPGASIIDGILQVFQELPETNFTDAVILLGDVLYSKAVMRSIISQSELCKIHSRVEPNPVTGKTEQETFSLSIPFDTRGLVVAALDRIPKGPNAKLRDLIVELRRAAINPLVETRDFTDDFDTPEDLEKIPLLEKAIEGE